MSKLIETFDAQFADGRTMKLYVYQVVIAAGHMGDPSATIEGSSWIEDDRERKLNWKDDNTFELVATGEVLTRVIG